MRITGLTYEDLTAFTPWVSQRMHNAANYARQCYSLNKTGFLSCTTFVKSRLDFESNFNAPCPFSGNICQSNDSNLRLDSGLISSEDVGLNLPSNQRMFQREVLHCAPLKTDIYHTRNVSERYSNFTRYSYGEYLENGSPLYNWTYETEDIIAKWRTQGVIGFRTTTPFDLVSFDAKFADGTLIANSSSFSPISELNVPSADLLLIFLVPRRATFLNRSDDPWYRATLAMSPDEGENSEYLSIEAASPMGCVQRFQSCDFNKKCGSLASFDDAAYSAWKMFFPTILENSSNWDTTHPEYAAASRLAHFGNIIWSESNLIDILTALGPTSLSSLQKSTVGRMGPLPNDQWKFDVSGWFETRMATIQANALDLARGTTDEAMLKYIREPVDKYQRALCNNQKIRSTDYTSLSLFGLYITYGIGIVIILASYIAEPLLALFYSQRKYEEYKFLEWAANGTLQLHRLAHQGLGPEKWSNYMDDIPKTRPGYFLTDIVRAYPPEDDNVQEMKPLLHAESTTTPFISEATVNLSCAEQHIGVPSRPDATAAETISQAVPGMWKALPPTPQPRSPHPQAVPPSLQAVLPSQRALSQSPQAVSPVSQAASPIPTSGAALGHRDHHSSPNMATFAGQLQNLPRDGRQGERSIAPTDRLPSYF